jgi:Thioesterase-like superfamily
LRGVSKDEGPGHMVRDGARAPPHHEDQALDFTAQIPSWSRAMTNQPFFTKDQDAFIPTQAANGPWDPKSLHGRVIVGLLAFVIEQRHGGDDFLPARLTVDMFRLPGFAPIEVKTRIVRDGLRIRVVEADFFSGGAAMARASCQLLRKTESPQGTVWSPPNWDVPAPANIAAPADPRLGMHGKWTIRPIVGAMGTVGPRRLWMSEVRDLVEGEPLTPFVRVAVAADFASPFANAGDQGLGYINSDVTLYLHRLPVREWIGFEVVNHHATDGIAIGECVLYDQQGPIGTSTVAALAQRKPMVQPARP